MPGLIPEVFLLRRMFNIITQNVLLFQNTFKETQLNLKGNTLKCNLKLNVQVKPKETHRLRVL